MDRAATSSQWSRIGKNIFAEGRFDAVGRNNIHLPADLALQIQLEAGELEERHALRQVDEKVKIACAALLAACEGAEDADVGDAVFLCDPKHARTDARECASCWGCRCERARGDKSWEMTSLL